jgi:predicted RNA polymerase sigma factor
VAAVLHVLYLLFDEGHTSSAGEHLLRVDLSTEAIRLARRAHGLLPDDPEAAGLLALMLLTDARRRARTSPAGDLIPLHEQDRSLWDRGAIDEGTALVTAAFAGARIGSYQVQAAIASLHGEAADFAATDWPQILWLYDLLLRMSDNPMVALNRAVAAAMVHGPARGLELVAALDADRRLAGHYRLDAVRAHLHERLGDLAAAIRHYRAAARGTANAAERHYLVTKAAALDDR